MSSRCRYMAKRGLSREASSLSRKGASIPVSETNDKSEKGPQRQCMTVVSPCTVPLRRVIAEPFEEQPARNQQERRSRGRGGKNSRQLLRVGAGTRVAQ